MKLMPAKAARHIKAAIKDLHRCLGYKEESPLYIQRALRNVTNANQWIVAQQLKEQFSNNKKMTRNP